MSTEHASLRTMACYTQGLDSDLNFSGSFDSDEMPNLDLERALTIVRALPVPPQIEDVWQQCPPTFGVSSYGNVCRIENGDYVAWTEETGSEVYTVDEACAYIDRIFLGGRR